MSGVVALVALAVALLALVILFAVGFRAATVPAFVCVIVTVLGSVVFIAAGIAWIVERFTT